MKIIKSLPLRNLVQILSVGSSFVFNSSSDDSITYTFDNGKYNFTQTVSKPRNVEFNIETMLLDEIRRNICRGYIRISEEQSKQLDGLKTNLNVLRKSKSFELTVLKHLGSTATFEQKKELFKRFVEEQGLSYCFTKLDLIKYK